LHFSEPRVHALVYEPTTGEAHKLPVDFMELVKDLRSVYDLYTLEGMPATSIMSSAAMQGNNVTVTDSSSGNSDLEDEEEVALQHLIDSYPSHSAEQKPVHKYAKIIDN